MDGHRRIPGKAMDTRHFKRFVTIVEQGSLNRAAEILHLSQPALSKSVQELEGIFGVPLLERGARGVVPTEFGTVVCERFRLLDVELRQIREEIEALRDASRGQVSIGVPPGHGFVNRVMTRVTSKLIGEGRRIRVTVTIGSRAQLLPALKSGELDVLVASMDAGAPREMEEEPLFTDRHVLVVRAGHPLADRKTASMADLAAFRWVASTECTVLTEELIAAAGGAPGRRKGDELIQSNSLLFIKQLIETTDAIGLIAHDAVTVEIDAGRFHEVSLLHDSPSLGVALSAREVGFLYRNDATLTSASRALMKDVRAICREIWGEPRTAR